MTLTIKLDGNWSSFQLANSAPPLSVTDSAIAPSARMLAPVRATPGQFVCRKALLFAITGLKQEAATASQNSVQGERPALVKQLTEGAYVCWDPKVPQKLHKPH